MDSLQRVPNAVRELGRAMAALKSRLQDANVRIGTSGRNPDGTDVMADDWGVLVHLDPVWSEMTSDEWEREG